MAGLYQPQTIGIRGEPTLSLPRVAAMCGVCRGTVNYWVKGITLQNGTTAALKAIRLGSRFKTSHEELDDFLAKLNPSRPAPSAAVAT